MTAGRVAGRRAPVGRRAAPASGEAVGGAYGEAELAADALASLDDALDPGGAARAAASIAELV